MAPLTPARPPHRPSPAAIVGPSAQAYGAQGVGERHAWERRGRRPQGLGWRERRAAGGSRTASVVLGPKDPERTDSSVPLPPPLYHLLSLPYHAPAVEFRPENVCGNSRQVIPPKLLTSTLQPTRRLLDTSVCVCGDDVREASRSRHHESHTRGLVVVVVVDP